MKIYFLCCIISLTNVVDIIPMSTYKLFNDFLTNILPQKECLLTCKSK